MQKIPTMFVRDESVKGHPVIDRVKPECQWVLDGEGYATVKMDGTNVKVDGGCLYKRQKPKTGDYNEASYVQCERVDPADRWAFEAFETEHGGGLYIGMVPPDGIYELVGPKVQGNSHGLKRHHLVMVVPPSTTVLDVPGGQPGRTFDELREYLSTHAIEGLVFHHPDGRMAKIKRRDFGLRWP